MLAALPFVFACSRVRVRARVRVPVCCVLHASRKSKELETNLSAITATLRNMELNEAKVP